MFQSVTLKHDGCFPGWLLISPALWNPLVLPGVWKTDGLSRVLHILHSLLFMMGKMISRFNWCHARKHLPLMASVWHGLERCLAVGWRNRDYVSASFILLDRWCQFIFLWGLKAVWDAKIESKILYIWHTLVANGGQEYNWIIRNTVIDCVEWIFRLALGRLFFCFV